jgi:peptidoglycan/LPS O-acetylase OafA/YrhL
VLGHIHAAGYWAKLHKPWLWWTAMGLILVALCTTAVPYMMLHNGALLPLFAILILGSAAGSAPSWLSHPWLVLLGEASYALYITHLLVWVYVKIGLERSGVDIQKPWVFPLYAVLALGVSVVTFRWLETPARKRLLAR